METVFIPALFFVDMCSFVTDLHIEYFLKIFLVSDTQNKLGVGSNFGH